MAAWSGMDHGAMPMGMPHLNDVEFDAYLANDRTLDDPEIVRVEAGARVRLRIINAAASTNFWLDLGALERRPGRGRRPRRRWQRLSGSRCSRWPSRSASTSACSCRRAPAPIPFWRVREGDTARTGIILATPGAAIARVPDRAEMPAGAVDLESGATPRCCGWLRPGHGGAAGAPPYSGSDGRHDGATPGASTASASARTPPLLVRQGERVEIRLVNGTDMSHPIHLHGHPFQVIAIDGHGVRRRAARHRPGSRSAAASPSPSSPTIPATGRCTATTSITWPPA